MVITPQTHFSYLSECQKWVTRRALTSKQCDTGEWRAQTASLQMAGEQEVETDAWRSAQERPPASAWTPRRPVLSLLQLAESTRTSIPRCVRLQRWQVAGLCAAAVREPVQACVACGAAARPGRQSLLAGGRRGSLSPLLAHSRCARIALAYRQVYDAPFEHSSSNFSYICTFIYHIASYHAAH